MTDEDRAIILIITYGIFMLTVFGGASLIVFGLGRSGWWFALAFAIVIWFGQMGVSVGSKS